MGKPNWKKMKEERAFEEPSEQWKKYEQENRRKLRRLREDNEESVYPPQPWYEVSE